MIRHLLLIKFKPSVTASSIDQVRLLFESMPGKIAGVEQIEWGLNNSPENLNRGFTHAVMMTFSNEQGRQNYLPHPQHEVLKKLFVPLLEDIVVFDYAVSPAATMSSD